MNNNSLRDKTRHTLRAYTRNAVIYDLQEWLLERLVYRRWRRRLWAQVRGDRVLEIGVGTGKNLPFAAAARQRIGFDLTWAMLRRAVPRNTEAVPLLLADAQQSPFAAASFDVAAATFVFCSVPDPVLGLQEVYRLLRPGGSLWLLEHQRSTWRAAGWLMDLMNPLMVRLTGVNINRRTVANVRQAGFAVDAVEMLDPVGVYVLIHARRPD